MKNGFTLIELLAAFVLFSIVMLLGFTAYYQMTQSFDQSTKKLALQNQLRDIHDQIIQHLRQTKSPKLQLAEPFESQQGMLCSLSPDQMIANQPIPILYLTGSNELSNRQSLAYQWDAATQRITAIIKKDGVNTSTIYLADATTPSILTAWKICLKDDNRSFHSNQQSETNPISTTLLFEYQTEKTTKQFSTKWTTGNWSNMLAHQNPFSDSSVAGLASVVAPAQFQSSNVHTDQVTLSWSRVPLATGYLITRNDGAIYTILAPDTVTFTDRSNLLPGQTYTYAIKSIQNGLESATQNTLQVQTPNEIALYYKKPANWTKVFIHYAIGNCNGSWTSTDPELIPSFTYTGFHHVRINLGNATMICAAFHDQASNWDNNQSANYILQAGITTLNGNQITASIPDILAPDQPSLTLFNKSATSITLNWNPPHDNVGIARYELFRNGVKLANCCDLRTSFTDNGLNARQTYQYHLVAVDRADNRSADSDSLAVSTDEYRLIVFYKPKLTLSGNEIYMRYRKASATNWNDVKMTVPLTHLQANGFYRYELALGTDASIQAAFRDQHMNWDNNGSKDYTIRHGTNSVDGNYASISTAMPDTPTIPSQLSATSTSTSIQLTWSAASGGGGISAYDIYRNGNYLTSMNGTTNTYQNQNLSSNTTYQYEIVARSNNGYYSYPAEIVKTTLSSE